METRAPVRQIKKVWKSIPTMEGAGVRLKRVFGFHEVPQLDPFLLLDCFHSDNRDDYVRGFPWHPHRGMETITYVLWTATWSTRTAWATGASSARATCSG